MSNNNETPNVRKKPNLLLALLPIVILIFFLYIGIKVYEKSPHIPLVLSSLFAAIIATTMLGYTWQELESGILATINRGMQACLILLIVGCLVGTWIGGGIVPGMIYYGMQILSPSIYLVATVLICSVVSLATGSSWTTAGTVGVALIGIAQGIGIPAPLAAGAIISGAYFGDKMSPLSDTTNLAPAMAGSTLFDHVRHMIYTTGPSYLIALVIFGILGARYAGQELDTAKISELLDIISGQFTINPLIFLPPVLVICMVIFKLPAIPGLVAGAIIGGLYGFLLQGQNFGEILEVAYNGFSLEFANATEAQGMIAALLTRGGMDSMLGTVALIICALSFGGILEATGSLEVVAENLLKYFVKGTGSLVAVTIFTSIFINTVAADQYLSIVVPGRMYKNEYPKRGLSPRNLSRTLEDGGTITSALIPWNTCGIYMSTALGIPTIAYIPYAFFNLINPIVSIVMASLGLFQMKITPEEQAAYEKSLLLAE
ncbi:MAG: Na+/H+ antiporter NhaC [Filifactoraceae bacterium]